LLEPKPELEIELELELELVLEPKPELDLELLPLLELPPSHEPLQILPAHGVIAQLQIQATLSGSS
jgi:hypothetical protein